MSQRDGKVNVDVNDSGVIFVADNDDDDEDDDDDDDGRASFPDNELNDQPQLSDFPRTHLRGLRQRNMAVNTWAHLATSTRRKLHNMQWVRRDGDEDDTL